MSALLPNLELVFGWLLAASWQASVLALVVLALQRIFGARLNPRWRYALWLLVVLRLVLPVLPESALSLFQFAPPPPAALTVTVTEPLFVAAPSLAPVRIPVAVPPPVRPISVYSLLALVWLAGALGLSLLTLIVNWRFAQQVAHSPAITDPELLRLFAEAKEEFHVRRAIRLIENGQVQSPAIMGLFHPTLLLPIDVREKFDARELRFIFLHELAHLKRGDVAVQALIAGLQILHWFNPVLWFAFRRMRIDREPATDALVLSRTGEDEKERYGLMLIKLLEHFNQRHSLATLVGILEDKDQFKRRFGLIARFTRGAYGWSLLGAGMLALLSIAFLTNAKISSSISEIQAQEKGIAAVVNGKPIYWSEIAYYYPSTSSDPIGTKFDRVKSEIDRQLVIQSFDPSTDSFRPTRVQERIDFAVKGFGGDKDAFLKNLKKNGGSLEQFTVRTREDEIWSYMEDRMVGVPTREYLNQLSPTEDKAELERPEMRKLSLQWRNNLRAQATIQWFGDLKAYAENHPDELTDLPQNSSHQAPEDDPLVEISATELEFKIDSNDPNQIEEFQAVLRSPTEKGLNAALQKTHGFLVLGTGPDTQFHLSALTPPKDPEAHKIFRSVAQLHVGEDTVDSKINLHWIDARHVQITCRLELRDGKGVSAGPHVATWIQPIGQDGILLLTKGGLTLLAPQSDGSQIGCILRFIARENPKVGVFALAASDQMKDVEFPPSTPETEEANKRNNPPMLDGGTLAQLVLGLQNEAESAPPGHEHLQILQGYCGADGSWRDVTSVLQKSIQNDSVKISWQQPYTEIGGDPAYLQVKTLVVSYRLDGVEKIATFREENPPVGLQAVLPTANETENSSPNAQMIAAVKQGDAVGLQKLINQGVELPKVSSDGEPLIFSAGSPEVAEILLKHGADVNARNQQKEAPIIYFSGRRGGQAAIVEVLLKHGADPNTRSREIGETPLMVAQDGATVDVLVAHGADVKATLTDGYGLGIMQMIGDQKPDYLDALIRNGVPFDPKADGPTMLLRATFRRNLAIMKAMFDRGVDPNQEGMMTKINGKPVMMKPFLIAIMNGHPDTISLFLDHGAKDEKAMDVALANRQAKAVTILWEHGVRTISELSYKISQQAPVGDLQKLLDSGVSADPPEDAKSSFSPLTIAAQLGEMDAVKLLVARGANVNQGAEPHPQSPDEVTSPLAMAASEGQLEAVQFLLDHGAVPSVAALWQATENSAPYDDQRPRVDFEKCVRILVDAGALKGTTPEEQGYVLASAMNTRQGPANETVLKMFLDAGISPEVPMPYIVDNGEKPNSVIGYYRDWYAKKKDDSTYGSMAATMKPLLDMLEAADKSASTQVIPSGGADPLAPPSAASAKNLIAAAQLNNVPEIARLLQLGVDVNAHDGDTNAILKAAEAGSVEAVTFLLAHKADPNSTSEPGYNYTPLALTKKPEIADLLLAAGGKVDATLYNRGVPLIDYRVSFGPPEMVEWFIAHGVDPVKAQGDQPDQTLLFDAGSPEVAEILIQHGVDVKARSKDGDTPIYGICQSQPKPAEIIRVLLKHGADPNARNKEGQTPLMVAPDGATVDALVAAGADLKARAKDGFGVIMNPQGNASRLKALIAHGAPFDLKAEGPTLMMSAAHLDNMDIIAYLLSLGVDPNLRGTWSKEANMYSAPLQTAVTFGHLDVAKFLLEHGAKVEPSITNKGEPGPDEMVNAIWNRRKDIVKLFWDHGVRNISGLTYAISQGEPVSEIQKLLDSGIPVDPPQDKFVSPLTLAAELGQLDVVTLLVQKGAKIDGDARPDASPLDQASWEGQDEAVAFLLQHGAKPNYQALWNVAWNVHPYPDQRSKDHFEKTLKLLIDAGALKDLTPEQKGRVLDAVISTRYPGGNGVALKLLLDAGLRPDLPLIGEDGKNYGTVIGYYRDIRAKNPQDDFGVYPLLDLLEAADKGAAPPTTDAVVPQPTAIVATDDVHLQVLALDLPESDYQANRGVIDDLVHRGYVQTLEGFPHVREITRSTFGAAKFGQAAGTMTDPNAPSLRLECTATRAQDKINLAGEVTINSSAWSDPPGQPNSLKHTPQASFPFNGTFVPSQLKVIAEEGMLEPASAQVARDQRPYRLFLFFTTWPVAGSADVDTRAPIMIKAQITADHKTQDVALYADASAFQNAQSWTNGAKVEATGGDAEIPADPSKIPAGFVEVRAKMVQIDEEDYQAHRGEIDGAVATGDEVPFRQLPSFDLLAEPRVLVRSGVSSVMEAVRVLPYASAFKKDESGKMVPSEFAKKEVGVRFELTPSAMGEKVSIAGVFTVTSLQGWKKIADDCAQPIFLTDGIPAVAVETESGKPVVLKTEYPEPHADDPTTIWKAEEPAHEPVKKQRRIFLFLTAVVVAGDPARLQAGHDLLPPRSECDAWVGRAKPEERETLGKAFDAANAFLMAMDARDYSAAPAMVDGVMNFKPEAWPAYVDGVYAQYGQAKERHLRSMGRVGLTTGSDLLHDVSITYEGTFQKGSETATVRELVALARTPKYDPQGRWKVTQFVLSVKGPAGDFVYPPAIGEAWARADVAAHGALAAAPDADVKTMPAALGAKLDYPDRSRLPFGYGGGYYPVPEGGTTNNAPAIKPMPDVMAAAYDGERYVPTFIPITDKGDVALDEKLIALVRDGRTDKVGKGDADEVWSLLGQGASANAKDGQGNSALTWALNFGKDEAAQALIKAGADGRALDVNGENAAWAAAKIYYCLGALDLLMREGVDVRGVNKKGETILVAMMRVHAAQAGKMNYMNDRVWTAAEFATYEARERRTVEILLDAHVDFNGKEGETTPLMAAAQGGHGPAIRALLAHGADTSFKDAGGNTALDLAKMFHPELVPLFTSPTNAPVAPHKSTTLNGWLHIPAEAHADFARSIGVMISDTSGRAYPINYDAEGRFSLVDLPPGVYHEEVHLVCKPRDEVITLDKIFSQTSVGAGPNPDYVISWGATPPADGGIEIGLKIVAIDEDVYQANKEKLDAGVKKEGAGIIELLNQMKGVSLLSTPSVTTMPGLKANIDIVREMPFPSSFAAPKMAALGAGADPGGPTNLIAYIPPTPTEFQTQDIGVSAEITPSLIGKTLSPEGAVLPNRIMVSGKFTVSEFTGFTPSNIVGTGTPSFNTSESHFVEALAEGELKGVWIPGAHYRSADSLNRLPGVKTDANAPTIKTRYLLFLSAREVD